MTVSALVGQLVLGQIVDLPPWPLSRDGEVIAMARVSGIRIQADGTRTEALGGGLWLLVPGPDALRVRMRVGAKTVEAPVEPPPGRIIIEAPPLVKGRERGGELRILVLDPDGVPDRAAAEPVIACSAGSVREVRALGKGRFTARYELPTARYPELAVITALSPRCPLCATPRAVGAAILPLAASIDIPGHAKPRMEVTVTVGGRSFGPVTADGAGSFKVPVVVMPGERLGKGSIVDQKGNRRSQVIDLHVPPVKRIACTVWPRALPADGRSTAQIWCVATDTTGLTAPEARLELVAARGRVTRPEQVDGGLFHATYRTPRGSGGRPDRLIASFPAAGPTAKHEILLDLATGAPSDLGYALGREPVPLGRSVPARVWARDDRGDALPPPASPPGAQVGFVTPGRFVARPDAGDWIQMAELRAELPPAPEAASLWLRREGDEWVAAARAVDMRPVAGVRLRFGSGATATTDRRGEARIPARSDSETVQGDRGLRAAGWAGLGSPIPPTGIARTFAIRLAPPGRASAAKGARPPPRDSKRHPLLASPVAGR